MADTIQKIFTDESLATLVSETKAYTDNAIPSVATQSKDGLMSSEDKTQLDNGGIPIVTTAGTGAAYTATVDGMTSLKVGAKITIIPHTVSTILAPTLNVNNLGAKAIRMPITYNTSASSNGVLEDWLASGKPVTVQYNGSYWLTVDICRPSAQYLYGTVPIANGGTGATTASAALTNLGLTATATELNYVDGATSNIQTQLNNKVNGVYSIKEADKIPSSPSANTIYLIPEGEPNSTKPYIISSTAPADTNKIWIDSGNYNILKVHTGTEWTTIGAVYS